MDNQGSSASRHKVFRKLFELPITEELLADYTCALSQTILLHGRMYISNNHVCFMSNIFSKTVVVVPIADIVRVEKATIALIIPNSIRFHCKNPTRKLFFASFMARDSAFDVISKVIETNHKTQLRLRGRETLSTNDARDIKRRVRLRSSPGSRPQHITQSGVSPGRSPVVSSSSSSARLTPPPAASSSGPRSRHRSVSKAVYSPQKVSRRDHTRRGSVVARSESVDFGEHVPQISKKLYQLDSTESTGLTLLCNERFPGLSLFQFWCLFFADNSPCSLGDFHVESKNRDVTVTTWKRWGVDKSSRRSESADFAFLDNDIVREFSCVMPLSGPIGPSETRLHKVQKLRQVHGSPQQGPLIVESCTVTPDVPFGDSFQVNVKWEVSPLPRAEDGVQVRIYAQVEYTKQSWSLGLLSGTISERGVADTKLFFQAWCRTAKAFAAKEQEEVAALKVLEKQWMEELGEEEEREEDEKEETPSSNQSPPVSSSSASVTAAAAAADTPRGTNKSSLFNARSIGVAVGICVLAWFFGGTVTLSHTSISFLLIVGAYVAMTVHAHFQKLKKRIAALERKREQ